MRNGRSPSDRPRDTHTKRPREYAAPRLGEGWRQGRPGDGWTGPWEGWNTKKNSELLLTFRPRAARKKKKTAQVCNTGNKNLSACLIVPKCADYDQSGACTGGFKTCTTCLGGNYLQSNNTCASICVGGALILWILWKQINDRNENPRGPRYRLRGKAWVGAKGSVL